MMREKHNERETDEWEKAKKEDEKTENKDGDACKGEIFFFSHEGKFGNLRSQSLSGTETTAGKTEEWRQKWVRECESTRGSCKTGERERESGFMV